MSGALLHDEMVLALEITGQYRVLRRLGPRPAIVPPEGCVVRRGLVLDVETTGLDPAKDEIIELAMVPFSYGPDGTIYEVFPGFDRLREPSVPISAEITKLTGITGELVAGHAIDPHEVADFVSGASLVVAHNADFDRRFAERLHEMFRTLPWACSATQVDWAAEGYEGRKLAYLASESGFFYDRHRALSDCLATVEMLARPLKVSGVPAMAKLLETARKPSYRIWAQNSPFDLKDILKARGYRWNGEANANPKAWYVDVDEVVLAAELEFLRDQIYRRELDLPIQRFTALNRFSDRV